MIKSYGLKYVWTENNFMMLIFLTTLCSDVGIPTDSDEFRWIPPLSDSFPMRSGAFRQLSETSNPLCEKTMRLRMTMATLCIGSWVVVYTLHIHWTYIGTCAVCMGFRLILMNSDEFRRIPHAFRLFPEPYRLLSILKRCSRLIASSGSTFNQQSLKSRWP